jgi:predicted phosphoadenosine phosphosulfate sulfurtransferase
MKRKIEGYIQLWEERAYEKGIPDEVPLRLSQLHKAPSYRQICLAILKNDQALTSLGLTAKVPECYRTLKRIE